MPKRTERKANVLFVDDDPVMREMMQDILAEEGYPLEVHASGLEAIKEIRSGLFDIVIVDLVLPDVGGMEVLEEAREVNPETAVIMMTGYASMESAVEALNRGAFSYIIKPFHIGEVKAVFKKAVHHIRLFKENRRLIEELELSRRKLEKTVEELEKANQVKSRFLANMSHELRTPINAVIGFTDFLLEDETLGEKQRRDVEHIFTNSQSLLSLINDILDLSRIEAEKVDISLSDFDVEPLITNCLEVITPILKDKPVKTEVDIEKNMPALTTDRDRLRQVIINLLSNAAKFTEKGTISIRVGFDRDGGTASISVSDTGIGIRKKDLACIFEEFQQINNKPEQRYAGTGLGLAISKKLVHLLGGNISVDSTFGSGSAFTVVIPLEPSIRE